MNFLSNFLSDNPFESIIDCPIGNLETAKKRSDIMVLKLGASAMAFIAASFVVLEVAHLSHLI